MFALKYFTRIFFGNKSIGAINTNYYGLDKAIVWTARPFTENNHNKMNRLEKWDSNWDKREVASKIELETDEDEDSGFDTDVARHLLLIRHGQFHIDAEKAEEMKLTELGKEQAMMTGKRLKELDIPYANLVHSSMIRAIETAKIISSQIPDVPVKECSLLEEGAPPIPPEPQVSKYKYPYQYYQDGARIEAAFRKYFYRPGTDQQDYTYSILVCHANVIRYFVCRALQYPAEGWMRLCLRHASITWLKIDASGKVYLITYGDAGYMPPHALTTI